MWRPHILIVGLLACVVATPARAQRLDISFNQPSYEIGDTIIVRVIGDANGEMDSEVFGTMLYDPDLVIPMWSMQRELKTFGVPWTLLPTLVRPEMNALDAFNQVGPAFPWFIDGVLFRDLTPGVNND